jgi:hypothetical protein
VKYVANPIEVDAFTITEIGTTGADGDRRLQLDNGEWVTATAEMTARMNPQRGDYWVIQLDGYIYLNPKEVFERKYHPASPSQVTSAGG